jgi:hypothetical protein
MKLHGGGGQPFGNLGASFQTGTTASAEGFIVNNHSARIGFVAFPNTVHAGIDARSTIETLTFIDRDPVPGKGIPQLVDPLIEARPDHIKKSLKFGTALDFQDEALHLLQREIGGSR